MKLLNSGVELRRAYIDVLEQLTSLEVKILECFYSLSSEESHSILLGDIRKERNISNQLLYESIDNLLRLRMCIIAVPKDGEVLSNHHLSLTPNSKLQLSILGLGFIRACHVSETNNQVA